MITIQPDGSIKVSSSREQLLLREHAGDYRTVVGGNGMLILGRTAGGPPEKLLMAGEIPRPGWVVEILNFICNSRLSGGLTLVSGTVRRELLFDAGALRLARSSARRDLLGEYLVREGVLSDEQIEGALHVDPAGRRLGQTIVDQGLLTVQQLYEHLQKRTESIFLDTVSLDNGVYWFSREIDLSRLPPSIYMDTQALLMEGLRRIDELNYYRETVPRRTMVLDRASSVLDSCSELEQKFIDCVNGRRTLSEISGIIGRIDQETVSIAHTLASRGFLELLPRHEIEEQELRAIVESFNRALSVIYDALHGDSERGALTRLGMEFLQNGGHENQTLREVALTEIGTLNYYNIRKLFEASRESDRIKLIVLVLTRYLSFVLFNVSEQVGAAEQEQLSIRVYGALGDILAATQ